MSNKNILTEKQIADFVHQHPAWEATDGTLVAEFKLTDFITAMAVVQKVAEKAEEADHHPTWCNTYNRLTFRLTTHEAGDVLTEKDTALAAAISDTIAACET